MGYETRYLGPGDLDAIYGIQTSCFPSPWPYADLKRDVGENPAARYVGIYMEETLIGYGSFWLIMEEAHLTHVAIVPRWRRQGAGRALMRALIQAASDCGARFIELECRAANAPARAFYHSLGFLRVGCKKGYYTDTGEDACVFAFVGMPPAHAENDPWLRQEE